MEITGTRLTTCVALRKEIQFLTRKGYLFEFMPVGKSRRDKTPPKRERTPPRQPPPPPHHKVINFIAGGSDISGKTYSQAKRIARDVRVRVAQTSINNGYPALIFDEKDTGQVTEPQQDSLVISLPVGNCLIKRILVDNGSAANIMMLTTLQHHYITTNGFGRK